MRGWGGYRGREVGQSQWTMVQMLANGDRRRKVHSDRAFGKNKRHFLSLIDLPCKQKHPEYHNKKYDLNREETATMQNTEARIAFRLI